MLSALLGLLGFFSILTGYPAVNHVRVGAFHRYAQSNGDACITAWTNDGDLCSVPDDTRGFDLKGPARNLMVHRLSGDNPSHLRAVTVNAMDEYGKNTAPMSSLGYGPAAAEDGRAWKADGIISIDGVLYIFVSKHDYPWRNKSLTIAGAIAGPPDVGNR